MHRLLLVAIATLLAPGTVEWERSDPVPSRLVGGVWAYTVQKGDSLRSIGSRFAVEPRIIATLNARRLEQALLPGTSLRLDNRHLAPADLPEETIVINVPQRMLFYRTGDLVLAFPVAVGSAGWRTPLGPFTIVEKEIDPTWDVPASIAREAAAKGRSLPPRIGPGPSNPLGRHWLRLSVGGVGIHGTNAPTSLYQAVTHGCIRVHPDDVAVLFDLVHVGTPGQIVYEPVLLAPVDGDVYLEVHRDVYRRRPQSAIAHVRDLALSAGLDAAIDWRLAERVAATPEGLARLISMPLGRIPQAFEKNHGAGRSGWHDRLPASRSDWQDTCGACPEERVRLHPIDGPSCRPSGPATIRLTMKGDPQ